MAVWLSPMQPAARGRVVSHPIVTSRAHRSRASTARAAASKKTEDMTPEEKAAER